MKGNISKMDFYLGDKDFFIGRSNGFTDDIKGIIQWWLSLLKIYISIQNLLFGKIVFYYKFLMYETKKVEETKGKEQEKIKASNAEGSIEGKFEDDYLLLTIQQFEG
ncbi:hypothetical protein ACJX0J_037184 [Zea mays]